jgi:N-acetyl-gamma-glutamyl-phosphate reductase
VFIPVLGNVYKGMAVSVPVETRLLKKKITLKEVHSLLTDFYRGRLFVKVMPLDADHLDNGLFKMQEANDTNRNDIFVYGNDQQILLMSRLDNLGKGASGAAIQNMNLMLGFPEDEGLKL